MRLPKFTEFQDHEKHKITEILLITFSFFPPQFITAFKLQKKLALELN